MTMRLNRRGFLQTTSAASLGYLFTGPAWSVSRAAGANGRLAVAGIGVGGKGRSDIEHAGSLMDVIAICDIDESERGLGGAKKRFEKAKVFTDFRKLFADADIVRNLDAVVVSTPDHTHALPSVMAMRRGKHVYCQKPLTHTVFEARLMREVAKQNKVCTQMGNQGTAANGLRRAVEFVQSGGIGAVKEAHVWTNRPIWPQAPKVSAANPPKTGECPKHVHWDEFLGPAADRPYAAGIHPFAWRGFWDFGTGAIGDMACHTANTAFMALKLAGPSRVSAEAGDVNPLSCPSFAHVTMEFPARGDLQPVILHWYEGKKNGQKLLPPEDLIRKVSKTGKLSDSGSILVGEKAIMYSPNDYGAEWIIATGSGHERLTGNPEKLPINNGGDLGQKKEWVEAIKANKPTAALANFDYASMLTEAFLLGNVAIRAGKAFEWDGETGKVKNCPEAEPFIHMEYRKGWDLLNEKV